MKETLPNIQVMKAFRLSVSHVQEQGTVHRRLSIYGHPLEVNAQLPMVQPPCSTCGFMSMDGMQPVPGGSAAKINQDRGLAIWP